MLICFCFLFFFLFFLIFNFFAYSCACVIKSNGVECEEPKIIKKQMEPKFEDVLKFLAKILECCFESIWTISGTAEPIIKHNQANFMPFSTAPIRKLLSQNNIPHTTIFYGCFGGRGGEGLDLETVENPWLLTPGFPTTLPSTVFLSTFPFPRFPSKHSTLAQ